MDQWLVGDSKLFPLKRRAQIRFPLQARASTGVDLRLVNDILGFAIALCLLHGNLGIAQQVLCGGPVVHARACVNCNAYAGGHEKVMLLALARRLYLAPETESRLSESSMDLLSQADGFFRALDIFQQDYELIRSKA